GEILAIIDIPNYLKDELSTKEINLDKCYYHIDNFYHRLYVLEEMYYRMISKIFLHRTETNRSTIEDVLSSFGYKELNTFLSNFNKDKHIKAVRKRSELSNDEYTLFKKAFEDAFPKDVVIKHFHEILPDKYHDLVTKAADTAWQSKRKSFSSVLKRMFVELGVEPKEVAAMLSSAKKEVAKLFAENLDNIIFDAGFKNFDSQGVEILQVTQRLIFCS
ncbi:unnamed protein product, partial [marine sediment metagenome]